VLDAATIDAPRDEAPPAPEVQDLTQKQLEATEVMAGPQTHTCGVGGSRSGKTFLFTRSMIMRGLRSPHSRHLFVRHHANALRSSVWLDTFPKVMRKCFPGVKAKSHRMDGFEELPNGSQLWFGGLDEGDRTEKILGQEYATIYAGECSQIPYGSIVVLRTRLAQPDTNLRLRGFYDLNPTSKKHWTNLEFGEKLDPISLKPLPNPEEFARFFLQPWDNAANLDASYLKNLENLPESYKIRFWRGEYSVEIDGALWTSDVIELNRDEPIDPRDNAALAQFARVEIGVDPSGAMSKFDIKSDEIGVVVVGRTHGVRGKRKAVVLEDATVRGGPDEWGRRVAAMYKKWRADAVVAEINYGGAMVVSTIKMVEPAIKVNVVTASRGKVQRAEPISALQEQDMVKYAGHFPELESQLCHFSKFGYQGDRSPDRADAFIWVASSLMVEETSTYTLAHVS
jgi:phage terminase large subunit-like protein